MAKYVVFVDDNFHHMDESHRYKLGEYDSCSQAMNECMKIVDEFIDKAYNDKISYQDLYSGYTMYGEDPFIITDDGDCRFSAWDYAKKRCQALICKREKC